MDKAERERITAENAARVAHGKFSRIHVSPSPIPSDESHAIEVWENSTTRQRYYYPIYRRATGGKWQYYKRDGQRLATTSYGGAASHIKQSSQHHTTAAIVEPDRPFNSTTGNY